jgi:hypothetical protein
MFMRQYYIIEVEEKALGSPIHKCYVRCDGTITFDREEAAEFPKKYGWAADTLCYFWNKQKVYRYIKVLVFEE